MVNTDRNITNAPMINGNYRTEEVLMALGNVFFNKCYICEKKLLHPSLFEIDHFVPQNVDPAKELEWSNLYLCCKECNGSRVKSYPIGGYLDPCDPDDDVENEIIYKLPATQYDEPLISPSSPNPTQKVLNTVKQLNRAYYGTKKTKMKCQALRNLITKEAKSLLTLLIEENNAVRDNDHVKLNETDQKINLMIDVDAPFSVFMKYLVAKYR